jgi:hypothetical protein
MRKTTIHIRYSDITYNLGAPDHPIVYDQGQRIGQANPVDFLNNDRRPNEENNDNDF